jgi:hypothetical protein
MIVAILKKAIKNGCKMKTIRVFVTKTYVSQNYAQGVHSFPITKNIGMPSKYRIFHGQNIGKYRNRNNKPKLVYPLPPLTYSKYKTV